VAGLGCPGMAEKAAPSIGHQSHSGGKSMNRRGFLGAILAASAAPAIVRAESLMRVSGIVMPKWAQTAKVTGSILIVSHHGMALGDIFTIAGTRKNFVVTQLDPHSNRIVTQYIPLAGIGR